MSTKSTVDFFSSHAWAYGHRRDDLHKIIRPWQRGHDYQDHSVSARHPLDTETDAELEALLWWIIERTDVLIVMAGMYVLNRRWMEFEILAAAYLGVPIIAVLDNGQERVPELARRYAACDDVKWRSASIRDAILSVLPPAQRRAFLWRRYFEQRAAEEALRQRPALLPQRQTIPFPAPRTNAFAPPPSPPNYGSLFDLPPAPTFGAIRPPPQQNAFAPPMTDPFASLFDFPLPAPSTPGAIRSAPNVDMFGFPAPAASIDPFATPISLADILADIEPTTTTGAFGALRRRLGEK